MSEDPKEDLDKTANTCMGLGTGVGALGLGAAMITGTVCPICIVAAPLLITTRIVQKIKSISKNRASNDSDIDTYLASHIKKN